MKRTKRKAVKRNKLTAAKLARGVRGLVKIRKVKNGIRVTVKR
jgi:hypothetical protein